LNYAVALADIDPFVSDAVPMAVCLHKISITKDVPMASLLVIINFYNFRAKILEDNNGWQFVKKKRIYRDTDKGKFFACECRLKVMMRFMRELTP
jgi:hypothetical protein